MNPDRVQSSALVDLKDSVQIHLLAETALFDSRQYEILSTEEVDDLKKQCEILKQRIEHTRSNLAIQSKYRDAAVSMSRLYSPGHSRRKSLLGNRASGGEAAREAEAEREAIQSKCEDLAAQLWDLEKRAIEPQRRLLEHTAGILQLTHKAAPRKTATPTPKVTLVNGVPASPESMFTGSNGRDSMEPPDDLLWDDGSVYRSLDGASSFDSGAPNGSARPNPIEIPMKSPVRQQTKELTEESDRLRQENHQLQQETDKLRAQADSLSAQIEDIKSQATGQSALLADTERKLEMANARLRQLLVESNATKADELGEPAPGQGTSGDSINSQLDYLEKALEAVAENPNPGSHAEASEAMQKLGYRLHELLLANGAPTHPAPAEDNAVFDEQMGYMYNSVQVVEDLLHKAAETSTKGTAEKQKGEQFEAVLMGLWDIIQAGYADIHQRARDRRRTRLEKGIKEDDDDMSDVENFDPNEQYSLPAFSTKVQWLYTQATKLKEQKAVLKRQIKQQRDLNSKSDSEKNEAIRLRVEEVEQARAALHRVELEADELRGQLSTAYSDLDAAQDQTNQSTSEQDAAIQEATEKLKERNARVASLEASSRENEMRLSAAEANIATITAQLKEAQSAKAEADKAVAAKEAELNSKEEELKSKQNELDESMGMVAEFKMEAMMAKAELDGAYGSRRERAAEAAALYDNAEMNKLQSQVAVLQPRCEELEKELRGTARDLKDITKQAIDAETKIADLETELDKVTQAARREKEQLQDALDGERLRVPSADNGPNGPLSPGGRSSSILTTTYREALKAERKKYEEQLRVCCAHPHGFGQEILTCTTERASRPQKGGGRTSRTQESPGARKEPAQPAITLPCCARPSPSHTFSAWDPPCLTFSGLSLSLFACIYFGSCSALRCLFWVAAPGFFSSVTLILFLGYTRERGSFGWGCSSVYIPTPLCSYLPVSNLSFPLSG